MINITQLRQKKFLTKLLITAASGYILMSTANAKIAIHPPHLLIFSVVDELIACHPIGKQSIEKIIGHELHLVSSTSFADYKTDENLDETNNIELIEYRESISRQLSSAEPILEIDVGPKCIAKRSVLNRYTGTKITGIPSGRSLDEETYYSKNYGGVELSFGFSERSPDCLTDIVMVGV